MNSQHKFRFSNKQIDQDVDNFIAFTKYFSDMISRHAIETGIFNYTSAASRSLLGFEPNELSGKSLYQLIHPDDRPIVESFVRQEATLEGEKTSYRLLRKEGDYIWVESIFCQDTRKKDGTSKEILCITRDITELKLAEAETRDSETKYRLLVEHTQDTIGIMTSDANWIYINNGGKKLFGFTRPGEVIGESLFKYVHPDQHQVLTEHLEKVKRTQRPVDIENLIILRTDRDTRQADVKFIPTNYKGRNTVQVVLRDVTERKKTEEMLQQAEKLTVVGQLAAGIAHEIRNPLTAIKGFTQLMDGAMENHYVSVILQELDRIDNIVGDLLILAKPQVVHVEQENIVKLLSRTVTLLNTQAIMKNIELITEFEVESIKIACEPDKLKQVFINIIKNAIEAMEKGGRIYIKLRLLREGRILIQFIDEGMGIPEDRLTKLGEPFYSTKEKGTGLGLMICQKIIRSHHGTMDIRSEMDKGTTVEVTLPTHFNDRKMGER
ncbi:two-component system sporulation sensor kinase A [Scopulibacillus darangshiensis]|uniref:histidine kinase n=1 Tax=Scopulibacillus darangshiensis TaxID=442528 RepID=A0A4V6NQL5_9BACL|nr:PAS domain S-box protein [Scopulibacillus darangshiensis]TCP27066.1 two-component system sporulation sensor kinase A [Scopulibacillus darangshiensis]